MRVKTTALLLLSLFSFGCSSLKKQQDTDPIAKSARGVLTRLIGERAYEIQLGIIPKASGNDAFEYEASNGVLTLKGSSGVAISRGFYDYLKSNEIGQMGWGGKRIAIPKKWPTTPKKYVASPFKFHYNFNVVTYGYTVPYWNWERWEQELDWMALHGVDFPLALVGTEAIATRVWKKLGLTKEEIDAFYVGPAHLPWQRMGNMIKHDGPLPDSWHTDQVALQHKILKRMRNLGMTPIAPAFAGFVPVGLKRIHPDIKLHTSKWVDFGPKTFASLLLPDGPVFNKIGKMFIQEWEKEFGKNEHYLADSFNEMAIPAPANDKKKRYEILSNFGESVYNSIKAGNPDATWVMQGWMLGYHRNYGWDADSCKALISKVPNDKMLILDMAADYNKLVWKNGMNYDYFKGFFGKKWVFSYLPNMGGCTPFTGNLDYYAKGTVEALNSPNRGNLLGSGMAMEGFENNEVLYELITDMGWRTKEANLDQWLENYCKSRYGSYPAKMKKAWDLLRKSCFGTFTQHARYNWQIRPGSMRKGSLNDSKEFFQAVEAFAACADQMQGNKLYQDDLIEMAALYLSLKLEEQIILVQEAYVLGETKIYNDCKKAIFEMFDAMDRLLESHPILRLQRWTDFARTHGETKALKDYYESNARRIVTVWGPPVNEYSARVWSGLIRDYYKPRWEFFFKSTETGKPFDFAKWEENWVNSTKISKIEPFANPINAAAKYVKIAGNYPVPKLNTPEGEIIGKWSPTELAKKNESGWTMLKIKLDPALLKHIKGVTFNYIRGNSDLTIGSAWIVADNIQVANERHVGTAGKKSSKNYYQLNVKKGATGNNQCILHAWVKGKKGDDTYGQIQLIRK